MYYLYCVVLWLFTGESWETLMERRSEYKAAANEARKQRKIAHLAKKLAPTVAAIQSLGLNKMNAGTWVYSHSVQKYLNLRECSHFYVSKITDTRYGLYVQCSNNGTYTLYEGLEVGCYEVLDQVKKFINGRLPLVNTNIFELPVSLRKDPNELCGCQMCKQSRRIENAGSESAPCKV